MRTLWIAVGFIVTLSGAAKAETLADALTNAYHHSGLLDQNRALLRAADEDVAIAVSATLPVITWSSQLTYARPALGGSELLTANARIAGELLLYDGGASALAIEAQKELVLSTRQALRNIEQQVLLRAVEAYQNVRRDSEFVALRENNLRLLTQELRAAQDRLEVGEVTRTDVALAEARLAAARSLFASAQGNLARSVEEYRNAVGRGPGALASVSPVRITNNIAEAKQLAVRTHPSLLEAQHAVMAAELNIKRAEAGQGPRATLNGSLSINQDFDDSQSVGITFGGPIYQGGLLSAQVRQFMARRDAARAGLHIVRHNIEQDVGNSYAFLQVARASRAASEEEVRAATVAFRGIREEANVGARTTLDVLNAEQELLDARANVIAAQADEVISSYRLLAAMGHLTARHLKLPVQEYDPSAYYNLVKTAPTARSEQGQALDRVLEAIGK